MWVRKKTAGAASGGYVWEKPNQVLWVDDRVARDLVGRPGGEFEETDAPEGKSPPEQAADTRSALEVSEQAALDARAAHESPSGTRLMDGRWAQTDTKGDEPVHTGIRDTGAEFAPANVASSGLDDPYRTLTPGSSENKPVVPGPVVDPDGDSSGGKQDKSSEPSSTKPNPTGTKTADKK